MSLTAQQDESVAYDEMDEYYHKNNHADYMDDYYTFAKWWERTHAYEASAATIASQKRRVAYETALLQTPSPLELPVDLTPSEALEKDGVVRINSALSATTAAKLRAELLERRENTYAHVDGGGDWKPYFGDLVLKDGKKRCDLLLPLVGNRGVQLALRELLVGEGSSPPLLYELFSSTLSDDAVLYELSALISEPGSQRQMIHSDNENQENGCVPLLTVFVSLREGDSRWAVPSSSLRLTRRRSMTNSPVSAIRATRYYEQHQLLLACLGLVMRLSTTRVYSTAEERISSTAAQHEPSSTSPFSIQTRTNPP